MGLQEYASIQARGGGAQVAVGSARSLVAGVAWVLFGGLKDLARRIDFIPRVLRHGARVFAWLSVRKRERRVSNRNGKKNGKRKVSDSPEVPQHKKKRYLFLVN